MSDFKVEKLPDEPIVLVSIYSSAQINGMEIYPESTHSTLELFNSFKEPFYYILDLSDAKLDIAQAIIGANKGAGGSGGTLRHPMVKEILVISKSNLVRVAAKGLGSKVFGSLAVSVFETLDEGLAYARNQTTDSK